MTLPVEVIEATRARRCLLFLGSHTTAEAASAQGLPWPDARDLALALGWRPPRRVLGARARVVTPSLREGAENLEASRGRGALLQELNARLPLASLRPTMAHDTAIGPFPVIVTTCLDRLVEGSARAKGEALRVIARDEAWPENAEDPLLLRLGGALDDPASLILTRSDAERRPWHADTRRVLRDLLRRQVLFFVGFRPDDEEMEILWTELTEVHGGELPRTYLAVPQGRIDDFLWQRWVWRGVQLFTADPAECLAELRAALDSGPARDR